MDKEPHKPLPTKSLAEERPVILGIKTTRWSDLTRHSFHICDNLSLDGIHGVVDRYTDIFNIRVLVALFTVTTRSGLLVIGESFA